MTQQEKEQYLKMFHEITEGIEALIRTRDHIMKLLLEHDPDCIHPEDRNLPSTFRFR